MSNYTDMYDTVNGKLIVVSDYNERIMSSHEIATINDIIVAVNREYPKYQTKFNRFELDHVHLFSNCNDDNDVSVVYRNKIEQFEIRYCLPCANWFVSYGIIDGGDELDPNCRITNLQLNNSMTAENVVKWLFNTMSLLDL